MHCEWITNEGICGVVCLSLSSLNQHLSEHLDRIRNNFQSSTHHSSLRQGRNIRKYNCPWVKCLYSVDTKNFQQLSLHVYFHCFHLSLQTAGIQCIRHKGLPLCRLQNNDLSLVIPKITQPYRCAWKNGKCEQE